MKISFVFPPMWPPISDGSLSIWNREVTTRLSPYADVLVYAGSFDSPAVPADAVAYNYLSTWLDNRVMERVRYFDRVLGTKRVLFATDVWYPAYALRVALDVRKRHPDVVHVYNYPQFAHLMRRLNPEIKLVLNMHGEWLTQVAFTDLRARLREVDLITSCSDFITASTSSKF